MISVYYNRINGFDHCRSKIIMNYVTTEQVNMWNHSQSFKDAKN